jgi:hypothetical protein
MVVFFSTTLCIKMIVCADGFLRPVSQRQTVMRALAPVKPRAAANSSGAIPSQAFDHDHLKAISESGSKG